MKTREDKKLFIGRGINGKNRLFGVFARAAAFFSPVLLIASGFILSLSPDAASIAKMSGGDFIVARGFVGTEGRRTSSGNLIFNATIGETGIGSASGSGVSLHAGYGKIAFQPGSVTSLTAVTKSTGALELSWTAPGLDGFKGDVLSGFYRVDYSADSSHAFSPTKYQLEFSTIVSAGSSQSLVINGLLPNTTYYTKIYLADPLKRFAEDSKRNDKSTLANAPVNPVLSGVYASSAVISWMLPAGGAEGYRADSSTMDFSSGGADAVIAMTPDGLQVSMTLTGLAPNTTYYFRVASRNWEGEKNYSAVIIAAMTRRALYMWPSGLTAATDIAARKVTLTWSQPVSERDPNGFVVILSTSPNAPVSNGTTFNAGDVLGDNSLVKFNAAVTTFTDSGLELDKQYFYHLYSQYADAVYSVSVSTSIFLDLPPMAPAGLNSSVTADRRQVILNWDSVISNNDGTYFASTATPRGVELASYRIERASAVAGAQWVSVATVPASARSYIDQLPDENRRYFYKVSAVDALDTADRGMVVDTDKNLFVMAPDQVTRIEIPSHLSDYVTAGHNPMGKAVLLRAVAETIPEDEEKTFESVRFEAVTPEDNQVVKQFQFSKPEISVVLGYKVQGNNVVPSRTGFSPGNYILASEAATGLGMYWDNGDKYVKLFGSVNTADRTVSVKTSRTGSYQIRKLFRESGVSFDISGLSNKVITPNGDGRNDETVFIFDNPKDSAFSGKIFDVEGAFVADMTPAGVTPDSLKWDGKAGGRAVKGGVYIYQIRSEGKVFTGTLVVIR